MIKQILYTAYGEIYMDTNPNFQIIIGYHGGLYDPLTKLIHMGRRDYDVLAGRWTSPDHDMWKHLSSNNIMPFNLYMFKNNNPISNSQDIKCYMTGKAFKLINIFTNWCLACHQWVGSSQYPCHNRVFQCSAQWTQAFLCQLTPMSERGCGHV